MIIASGERSQFPNVGPTERKLQKGDLIRMEIFGQKNGYLSRSVPHRCGRAGNSEQQKIWANLIECKYLVMDMIKPGAQLQGDLPKASWRSLANWVLTRSASSPTASACISTRSPTWAVTATRSSKPEW